MHFDISQCAFYFLQAEITWFPSYIFWESVFHFRTRVPISSVMSIRKIYMHVNKHLVELSNLTWTVT